MNSKQNWRVNLEPELAALNFDTKTSGYCQQTCTGL